MGKMSITTNVSIWVGVKLKRTNILNVSQNGNGIPMSNAIKTRNYVKLNLAKLNLYEMIGL